MIYYSIQEKLTCSRIHSSTSADGWILPARHRCWRGTRRSRLPAQAAAAADSRCVMNFEHFIKKEMEPQDYDILLPYF